MTLNDVLCPYFALFSEFDSFAGRLRQSGWR